MFLTLSRVCGEYEVQEGGRPHRFRSSPLEKRVQTVCDCPVKKVVAVHWKS